MISGLSLSVHEDLYETGKFLAYRYSCPIFITREFGTLLAGEDNLLGKGASPKIRSGTLTFVSYDGQIYGLTCRHVVEGLKAAQNEFRTDYKKKYNLDPPVSPYGFFFPKEKAQIHINSEFYFADGDTFTNQFPDIAIAKISPDKLRQIGRHALSSDKIQNGVYVPEGIACIAQGYPELSRNIKNQNTLAISSVTALAPCIQKSHGNLTMQAELCSPLPMENDNLSGMSGGPILWCSEDKWGLLGIIKKGRDLNPTLDSLFSGPTIWIEGLELTEIFLLDLIKKIPLNDISLHDLSKILHSTKGDL